MAVLPLHTSGHEILNSDNDPVILDGAAMADLGWRYTEQTWQGGSTSIAGRFATYVTDFEDRATVVRCPVGGGSLFMSDPTYDNATNLLASVKNLLGLCIDQDYYFVLDYHGGITQAQINSLAANPEPLYQWWDYWLEQTYEGTKFYDIPNFLAEFYNEPDGDDWGGDSVWQSVSTVGVDRIQEHNADIPIILSSYNFNLIDPAYVTSPLAGNVIYSWDHYYKDHSGDEHTDYETGDYTAGRQLMESIMNQTRLEYANQIPIICSEFGFASWHFYDGNGPMVEQAVWDYMDIINQTGTGWLNWMIWDSGNYGLWNSNFASLRFPTGTVMLELLPPFEGPPIPPAPAVPVPVAVYTYNMFGENICL